MINLLGTSTWAVCSGNSLGGCSDSQAQSIPPSATCAIDAVAITGADQSNQGNVRRTSFGQIPVGFTHTGGPTLTYTASLSGLNATDSGTSITESECEGTLTAFFSQSEQKNISVQVFQAELNRIITSQAPLQVIFDKLPPVVNIQRVFPGTGAEEGAGLEYSAGTTYFTSQDVFIRARVVDPAPAQDALKLSMQVIEGLSVKPPPIPADSQNAGSFGFPVGLSSEPEGEYLLRIAGLDSDSELFDDGSPANVSEGLLLRVRLDKTDPIITRLELIKNPQTPDQTVEQIPGVFIRSGRVRVRATFSENLGRPPTLEIQQLGNGVGDPPDQPITATFDSELFAANPSVVEYEFSPLVGPEEIGPVTFTFLPNGTDLAGRPINLSQGAVNGGVVNRAAIVDTVPPDLNRIDPQNPGEVRTIPGNNEKIPRGSFPRQITMIVRDYNLPQNIDLGDGGADSQLRETSNASGVDFSKIIESSESSTEDGVQVEIKDPTDNPIIGTLVTQPPNGLIYLLPEVEALFPQGGGLAPEGTYSVRVTLLDKVGNKGVETFFFVVDNTDVAADSIRVALLPAPDAGADFQPDSPNPGLENPIDAKEIPDNPDLIDLSTLTSVNTLQGFRVCSTDRTFDLTRSLRSIALKARLNGPDTVARTLNSTGAANLGAANLCETQGEVSFQVPNDQTAAFPNLGLFPNPSSAGPNIEPGTRDPRFGQFDGPYLVEVQALDDAGNQSDPIRKEFLLDTTQPFTELTFPADNSKINSPLRHISSILVDPHPPRIHTFDEVGHINFGSGISVDRSSIKLTLRTPYQPAVLNRSDLFLQDGTLRGKLTFTHIPNSLDPTKPSFNPKDDAFRVLLEFVDKSTTVTSLPVDGLADGIYEIESIPVDNSGNSVNPAVNGDSNAGWSAFPAGERRNRPKEVTNTFFFLLDSIAPSLTLDPIGTGTSQDVLSVSGRNFELTGKARDLSAQLQAAQGGAGIDRVEYEVVLQTLDGELVPPIAGSQNSKPKNNPILAAQLAILDPLRQKSKDPHTSSTKPLDPSSYAALELEERTWRIRGQLPPQDEVISQADNSTGKQANYFLRILAYDLAGNVTKRTLQMNLQFGKLTPPVLVAPDFNESFTRGIVKFEWRPVLNAEEYILHLSHPNGEKTTESVLPNGANNPTLNKVFSKEGEYEWFVEAKDSVGNLGEPTFIRKFSIDRTAPKVNILSWLDPSPDSKGTLTIGQFRMQIQFSEELSKAPRVQFQPFSASLSPQLVVTDKTTGKVWEGVATIPETATALWDGFATVSVSRATDRAGNAMKEDKDFRFEIDTGPAYEVKFFENPVFRTEVVLVIRSSEKLAGPPVLFNPQGVEIVGQDLVKVGDTTFTAILRIIGATSQQKGRLEITGTDLLGNSSTRKVSFPLQGADQDGSASIRNSKLKLILPSGSLPPDQLVGIFPRSDLELDTQLAARYSVSQAGKGGSLKKVRDLETLYPSHLALKKPGSIEFLSDEKLQKGEGVFLESADGIHFLGSVAQQAFSISQFGSLAVYSDRTPPRMEFEDEDELLSLDSIRPGFHLKVFDEGVGLEAKSLKGTLAGSQLKFRMLDDGLVEARVQGSLPRGSHSIELEGSDRLGNIARLSTHAVIAGPIRIRALSFPNPARNFAMIQYDLNRRADSVELRIFDSAEGLVFASSSEEDMDLTLDITRNQFQWNLENTGGRPVSNGIYYCQLQAMDSQGRVDRAILRIAVIR